MANKKFQDLLRLDSLKSAEHTYVLILWMLNSQYTPKVSVFRKREECFSLWQTTQESNNEVIMKNAASSYDFKKN